MRAIEGCQESSASLQSAFCLKLIGYRVTNVELDEFELVGDLLSVQIHYDAFNQWRCAMLEELEYWGTMFYYAGETENSSWQDGDPCVERVVGDEVTSIDFFTREDVEKIFHSDEGENDEASWIMVGKLKDGRYFFLEAGCDYTGWD